MNNADESHKLMDDSRHRTEQDNGNNPELQKLYSHWILLVMTFTCFFVMQVQTINVSLAIIEMVNWTAIENGQTPICATNISLLTRRDGPFVWDNVLQSQILASFMYGIAILRFPAEIVANHIKHKWLPFIGTMMSSLCNFLFPTFAKVNGHIFLIAQIIKAISQAIIRPSFTLMIEQWVDRASVDTYLSYAEIGYQVGGFITVIGVGLLCSSPEYSWETVFYFSGSLGIAWSFVWAYIVCDYNYPTAMVTGSEPYLFRSKKADPVPWKAILKSKPVWSYVLLGVAFYWAYSFSVLLLPMYMKRVFEADMEWNTLASSVPFLLLSFLFVLTVFVSERFVQTGVFRKESVRKFDVIVGLSGFAGASILITFTGCQKGISTVVLMFGIGFLSVVLSALINLPRDMSPRYSGILQGLMNSIGASVGSLVPLMVALLADSTQGIGHWYKIFNFSTLWNVIALIIFLAFGSCDLQYWDDPAHVVHPLNTRHLLDERIPPLTYRITESHHQIQVPESSCPVLKKTAIVDKEKLAQLLQSQAMRRAKSSKVNYVYSKDDNDSQ